MIIYNSILITMTICYFIASVPFGLLLSKHFKNQDIKKHGSGNIGATNVLRVAGKKLALLTLILDFAKSFIPLLLIKKISNYDSIPFNKDIIILTIGTSSILGHIFPIWLNFKGGKGVATSLGVYFAYDYYLGLTGCISWFSIFIIFKYSSLASIFMVVSTTIASFIFHSLEVGMIFMIIGLIIIATHQKNILRLIVGIENKFSLNSRK